MLKRTLRRWAGALVTFLHAPAVPKARPVMLPASVLPFVSIRLTCPSCGKTVRITSQVEAYCINPLCEDVLEVCRVTFIMESVREYRDAPRA